MRIEKIERHGEESSQKSSIPKVKVAVNQCED